MIGHFIHALYAELKWDFTFSLSYVSKIWRFYPSIFKTTYAWYCNKSANLIKDISFIKFNIEFNGNVSFVTIHVISIPSIYNILFVSFILSNTENLSQTNSYFVILWCAHLQQKKMLMDINTKRTLLFKACNGISIVTTKRSRDISWANIVSE